MRRSSRIQNTPASIGRWAGQLHLLRGCGRVIGGAILGSTSPRVLGLNVQGVAAMNVSAPPNVLV
ncbi:MAG TPA: hypothetical protein VNL71_01290, partial [Chloroflexota bacterium]|nr:hypothetical protein [Chloroflexota bacterium]